MLAPRSAETLKEMKVSVEIDVVREVALIGNDVGRVRLVDAAAECGWKMLPLQGKNVLAVRLARWNEVGRRGPFGSTAFYRGHADHRRGTLLVVEG